MKNDLTVIILTYNEEANIKYSVSNVINWAADVFVLDSYSTDKTVDVAAALGAKAFYNKFGDFSLQRKHALNNLPIKTEWVFFLDADEYLTEELKEEIIRVLKSPSYDAYMAKRRFYWMGKWIRRGYYPTWFVRLGRRNSIDCDNRPVNEHLICKTGNAGRLKNDFIDYNRKGLKEWISKHNDYSTREARYLFDDKKEKYNFYGSQYEKKRWLRVNIWNKLPPVIRPFLYFGYIYFLKLGFMDGPRALMYHFLHSFSYRMLIDFKYLGIKWNKKYLCSKDRRSAHKPNG